MVSARPKKRTLVRWDENLNELLLLTVQSVCNAQSVKIPWADVAKTMGHNATEGAIVQHLAKLRTRRVAAGKAVPPALKRGGAGGGGGLSGKASEVSTPRTRKRTKSLREDVADNWASSDEEWVERRGPARRNSSSKQKKTAQIGRDQDSEDSDESAEKLLVPGAKFLELPNDRVKMEAPDSPPSAEEKKSKLVVLKYRKSATEAGDERADIPEEALVDRPVAPDSSNSNSTNPFSSLFSPNNDLQLDQGGFGLMDFTATPLDMPDSHLGLPPNDFDMLSSLILPEATYDPPYSDSMGMPMDFFSGTFDFPRLDPSNADYNTADQPYLFGDAK